MRRYKTLLFNDIRQAGRDSVLMAAIFGPLALILVSRFGFSAAAAWTEAVYSFGLSAYAGFAAALLVVIVPMLTGTLAGLLMLDERDEGVIACFAVTPLTRKGYLAYRIAAPAMLCAAMSALYMALSGLTEPRPESLLALLLLIMEAPCFALLLAAFSANKVEGLALSKIGGLMLAGPVIAYFVPDAWQPAGVLVPTYWPAKVLLSGMEDGLPAAFGYFGAGMVLHAALLISMVRLFLRRAD